MLAKKMLAHYREGLFNLILLSLVNALSKLCKTKTNYQSSDYQLSNHMYPKGCCYFDKGKLASRSKLLHPKNKICFLYADIFYYRLMPFYSNSKKNLFSGKKANFVPYKPKARKMCS